MFSETAYSITKPPRYIDISSRSTYGLFFLSQRPRMGSPSTKQHKICNPHVWSWGRMKTCIWNMWAHESDIGSQPQCYSKWAYRALVYCWYRTCMAVRRTSGKTCRTCHQQNQKIDMTRRKTTSHFKNLTSRQATHSKINLSSLARLDARLHYSPIFAREQKVIAIPITSWTSIAQFPHLFTSFNFFFWERRVERNNYASFNLYKLGRHWNLTSSVYCLSPLTLCSISASESGTSFSRRKTCAIITKKKRKKKRLACRIELQGKYKKSRDWWCIDNSISKVTRLRMKKIKIGKQSYKRQRGMKRTRYIRRKARRMKEKGKKTVAKTYIKGSVDVSWAEEVEEMHQINEHAEWCHLATTGRVAMSLIPATTTAATTMTASGDWNEHTKLWDDRKSE